MPHGAPPDPAPGGVPATPLHERTTDRPIDILEQRIGKLAQTIRVAAGLVLLGIAVLMYVNGSVFKAFYPYAITLFFGASGLWLLVTILPRVKIRQFAFEMFLLVTVSLLLRTFYPEMFTLDSDSGPKANPTVSDEAVVSNEKYDRFVTSLATFESSVQELLAAEKPPATDAVHNLLSGDHYRAVVTAYKNLPTMEREKAFTTYAAARDLHETLLTANRTSGDGTKINVLEVSAKQAIQNKLANLKATMEDSKEETKQVAQ
ncbi:MAG: hypothetical protein HUU55_03170 [Myxococcales bacterium]|nr:hypothetical protein [Myxococcales bacterium]